MNGFWWGIGYWLMESGLATLGNHLWQSTLLALPVGALALLLRGNAARVRHALWMVASLKFLVPFALLAALGAQLSWQPDMTGPDAQMPRALVLAGEIAAPVDRSEVLRPADSIAESGRWMEVLLLLALATWLLGALVVAMRWARHWRALRRTLRAAGAAHGVQFPVPVRVTAEPFEPGIVGIFRPVLLIPAGMVERLTPEQLRAVLAHEACHLRRRDNLTAALHMLVEVLFWFHPLVWWIGARLTDERERACDEQVLREGHVPGQYAEAILAVCEHYVASRLPCVSGVSGSDLRRRIGIIARNPLVATLGRSKRAMLGGLALMSVAVPIVAGMVTWRETRVRTLGRDALGQYITAFTSHAQCTWPGESYAAQQRELAARASLLEAADTRRALLYAVLANSAPDVRRLLAAGAPRTVDAFPLHNSLMHVATQVADAPVLQALLDAGLPLDELDSALGRSGSAQIGYTPLMVAITSGRTQNAEWLIAHGADVNAANGAGQTALSLAMISCAGGGEGQAMASQLIRAGAIPTEQARRIARNLQIDLGPATSVRVVAPVTRQPEAVTAASRGDAAQPAVFVTAARMRQDWRAPTAQELDAIALRADSPTRFASAGGDFDGDGQPDQAALFLSTNGQNEGLFFRLSSQDADGWLQVANVFRIQQAAGGPAAGPVMGVAEAQSGTYATACGKGYWTCGEGEPAEVQLEHPGIRFFRFESASSLVYWDGEALRRVWTSD